MQEELDFTNTFLNQILDDNYYQFIKNMPNKITSVNNEIDKIKSDKEVITAKISENKANGCPRYRRRNINNSEAVIESVDIISKNLNDLVYSYYAINKLSKSICESYNVGVEGDILKEEISKLSDKILETEIFEQKIEKDNEKNYLIIKNYFQYFEENLENTDDDIDFYDINVDNLKDRPILKICEKSVELPYTKKEVLEFMNEYPREYKTPQDVITKEFTVATSLYKRYPILSRFKETYYLCRTKEMMNIFDSFNYAKNLMFNSKINSYVIAAVKSVRQLEEYISCLENNKLDEYKYFKIIFEINPHSV